MPLVDEWIEKREVTKRGEDTNWHEFNLGKFWFVKIRVIRVSVFSSSTLTQPLLRRFEQHFVRFLQNGGNFFGEGVVFYGGLQF